MTAAAGAAHSAAARRYYAAPSALEAGTFPAVFLSFPSTKDSEWSARFPGKSTAHIISEAPLEWFEEWRGDGFRVRKRGEDYEALKAELTRRLLVRNPLPTPCLRLRVATVWPDRSSG